MALKYYKNAKRYAQEIPLPGSRSLKLMPGYYVFGDFAAISSLSDEGVSEPAEVTATPSLLAFEEDVSLTNLPTVAAQDGKVLMTDGTDVIWGTPADITGGVDGAGLADSVAYWTDENTLVALGGVVTSGGDLRSVALLGVNGTGTADLQIASVPPDQGADALDGFDVSITGADAVDGTDTHDPKVGGSIYLLPGAGVNGGDNGEVKIGNSLGQIVAGFKGTLSNLTITDANNGVKDVVAGAITGTTLNIDSIAGAAGSALAIDGTAPAAAAAAQAGTNVEISASSAVDGTDTHLAAAGGDVVLTVGGSVNGGVNGKVLIDGRSIFEGEVLINGFALTVDSAGVTADSYTLGALQTPPASASATGITGEIRFGTDGYLYLCTATDTWVRVQLQTWV